MCPPAGLHLYPRSDWGSWSYMVSGLETSLNRGVSLVEVLLAGPGSWGAWLGALCVGDSSCWPASWLDAKPRLLV